MNRLSRFVGFALLAVVASSPAVSQPPGGPGGPPPFELGRLFPPRILDELDLTPAQRKQLDRLEAGLKAKLEGLLTPEQRKLAETARPPGPRGPGGGRGRVEALPLDTSAVPKFARLVLHGSLRSPSTAGSPFTLTGDAAEGLLGDARVENNGGGFRLLSGIDANGDGVRAGRATCTVTGLGGETGRWYRVSVRALAQDGFAVGKDNLFLRVGFAKGGGANSLDAVKKSIAAKVERERVDFADPLTRKALGRATWRTYAIDVRTPFPDVDTLTIAVGFGDGAGKAERSEFWVSEVEVRPIPDPAGYSPPAGPPAAPPTLKSLVRLGGRWYYDPRGGDREPPKQFDHTNADRLHYLSGRLETPFAGNTSAWLRRGYLDAAGERVLEDTFVPDAVVITLTPTHLVMRSKNLPNHPTAVFPDTGRFLDGNPNVIQERRDTWHLPLDPKPNPRRPAAITPADSHALPMGPIGVAVNGVVFFNPFDEGMEEAIGRLDRCCGHPGPGREYHYHKYPVCVNTPWDDDGTAHSPIIGFAFDGFPVYGPYEAKGVLAKDATANPLNAYNLHADAARGPHYHVTPGQFPHLIGGYWGTPDGKNRGRKGGR